MARRHRPVDAPGRRPQRRPKVAARAAARPALVAPPSNENRTPNSARPASQAPH
jgi:hypothetical protein